MPLARPVGQIVIMGGVPGEDPHPPVERLAYLGRDVYDRVGLLEEVVRPAQNHYHLSGANIVIRLAPFIPKWHVRHGINVYEALPVVLSIPAGEGSQNVGGCDRFHCGARQAI